MTGIRLLRGDGPTVAVIIDQAHPPLGLVSILPMTRALGDRMVADWSPTIVSSCEFPERFIEAARAFVVGDPRDPETQLGPMVDEAAAQRTDGWVREAVEMGGRVLLGGSVEDSFFPPTVLVDTPREAQVCSNEAFVPLVVAFRLGDFGDAIREVNDSFYGLQTGVFTNDLEHA